MDARQIKLIDTSGRNGQPAPEFWDKRPAEAPVGQAGLDGRSAGTPTHGTPGTDIRVRLAYSADEPGIAQVVGEGAHTGQKWKIARDEKLLLSAKGGDGGAGGRGEDGQAGGRGRDGRDATRHRNGEDGDDGAPGGNGGYGSSGADGAAGGHVFVTVHDEDTDLLLPLLFDVRGGAGGISGHHGQPGDGGVGGQGGQGHVWTEKHSNSVSAHSRPGGRNGRNAPPGHMPSTNLTAGRSGPQGSVQVKVIRGDLSEATYPGVYMLQVVSFDIIDENEDGINEPGEHLLVHNIRVRNSGGMPSPEQRTIQLLIQGTQFLEPIATAPLELPRSIQPGQEVDVPGVLRAFIRNEWSEKPLGQFLRYEEKVSLVAFFNERLGRPIPNFSGVSVVYIQYPLALDPPRYLDCVSKGNSVRFSWTLHNNSTKTYGVDGMLRRAAATKLTDRYRFFTLTHATEEKPEEATDDIPELEPNSVMTIDQDFRVDERALEFSEGFLSLELMLSDPITGKMRSVQKHQMNMQISGVYSLSQNPSFLLVVNSKTPNHAIHQIITLIRYRLHTSLDIFNLSLTGSYESPVTKDNVLKSYQGKSVIIFGNKFPFFDKGDRNPWDILDPWQTGLLIKSRTSILFAAVDDFQGLNDWAAKVTFPASDFSAGAHSVSQTTSQGLVAELKKTDPKQLTSDMVTHRIPVKKGTFGSLQSKMDSAAKSVAQTLNKNMPLRRFIAVPDMGALEQSSAMGVLIVCEGVPRNSNILACAGPFPPSPPGTHAIADYQMYFIVSCLPFDVKVRMFWNMAGRATGAGGVSCTTIYSGIGGFYQPAPGTPAVVDSKILAALCLSIQFNITSEIYRFTSTKPRFADPITAEEKLLQLSLTAQFLAAAPAAHQITDLAAAQLLVSTLGSVHALANPLSPWQSIKGAFSWMGNRKGKLTPALNGQLFAALAAVCAPEVAATAKDHVLQRSKQVKAGIRASGGKKCFENFGKSELGGLVGGVDAKQITLLDLTELNPASKALDASALNTHVQDYHLHRQTTKHLEMSAKARLVEMVNPVS
ncbi:hypothetical protein B0H63DRAFT_557564 [Podospora didyma]|uniref:DUF7932 domain-containing protein n=1 Tax=Podospora didyma TaxID=330526 RepID=A0AAE0NZS1_9PEZI|nr:hypothetical protein B0H63DRAFT_557564 [Podospora didyma]